MASLCSTIRLISAYSYSNSSRIYGYLKANNRIARKAKVFHLERSSESCVGRRAPLGRTDEGACPYASWVLSFLGKKDDLASDLGLLDELVGSLRFA